MQASARTCGDPAAWMVANSKGGGIETRTHRFDFTDGLTATGVWAEAIGSPEGVTATIILNDRGRQESAAQISERVNRGEKVLALDLIFTGDAAPQFQYPNHDRMLASLGERSLGMRVSQLLTIARWLAAQAGVRQVRVEAAGMRSQVAAMAARALEPGRFSGLVVRGGAETFGELLRKSVPYADAPELFCLDLYRAQGLGRAGRVDPCEPRAARDALIQRQRDRPSDSPARGGSQPMVPP